MVLVVVLHVSGAWIVTGGTNAGVMKHVGEAVRDFGLTSERKVTTIGIAPWGCVQNKELLMNVIFEILINIIIFIFSFFYLIFS